MLASLIQQEIGRALKGKGPEMSTPTDYMNLAHLTDFSGSILNHACNTAFLYDCPSYIVDSRASSHMCNNLNTFANYTHPDLPTPVHLPDNTTKLVTAIGNVNLPNNLTLVDCLHGSKNESV